MITKFMAGVLEELIAAFNRFIVWTIERKAAQDSVKPDQTQEERQRAADQITRLPDRPE